MSQATFDEVLDAIEHLSVDAQTELLEVVRRRLAERGHRRVVEEINQARIELSEGAAKPTSAEDLIREIQS